jgi:NtrC-family two-component system sensor histidine kinase KinB
MNTKTRLTLLLGVMLLLVTTVAVVSLATIWRLRGEGLAVIKANYDSIAHMQAMLNVVDTVQDPARRQALLLQHMGSQQGNVTEPLESAATAALVRAVEALPAATDGLPRLRRAIAGVMEVNRVAIVHKAEQQQRLADRAVLWISLTATFTFLIGFSLFMSMPTLITDPIRTLTEGIDKVAAGNYRQRVQLLRKDEFGHMAARFNVMAGELERWSTSNLARIITEKARAEAVINSLSDPSIGLDEAGRILFMNRPAAELLGVDPAEMFGADAQDAARCNDLLAHILKAPGGPPFKAVLGGREQQFTVERDPIITAQGPVGTVYTLHNVTSYLERDQAKTMFLATISHELKTPLASTDIGLGLLERQQATRLTADQAAILSDLRKDHQRLVRIVSELLDMAQVETGRVRLSTAPHQVDAIIGEAVQALRPTADARGIRVAVQPLPQGTPVMADADKATWSLINLLSNALRHAPADTTVSIHVRADAQRVSLAVADEGPGLSPEQQAHLFERFAPHASSGTGLGLSIARDLMRAMGGDITYADGERGGAVFTLHFAAVAQG